MRQVQCECADVNKSDTSINGTNVLSVDLAAEWWVMRLSRLPLIGACSSAVLETYRVNIRIAGGINLF
jgi:hypothetical protein